ncbi:MAG: LysM peptidoglycan-binding domain-containing protein [bacterium]
MSSLKCVLAFTILMVSVGCVILPSQPKLTPLEEAQNAVAEAERAIGEAEAAGAQTYAPTNLALAKDFLKLSLDALATAGAGDRGLDNEVVYRESASLARRASGEASLALSKVKLGKEAQGVIEGARVSLKGAQANINVDIEEVARASNLLKVAQQKFSEGEYKAAREQALTAQVVAEEAVRSARTPEGSKAIIEQARHAIEDARSSDVALAIIESSLKKLQEAEKLHAEGRYTEAVNFANESRYIAERERLRVDAERAIGDVRDELVNPTKYYPPLTVQRATDILTDSQIAFSQGDYISALDRSNEALKLLGLPQVAVKATLPPPAAAPPERLPPPSSPAKEGEKAPSPPTKGERVHTVRRGETLWAIAGSPQVYSDPYQWIRIYEANLKRLRDPDHILPGQKLTIPDPNAIPPGYYLVRKGDTLWSIAGKEAAFGNSQMWFQLYRANRDRIRNPDLIYPYQLLSIER